MPICTNCGTIHHEENQHLCLPPIEKGYEYRPVYVKVQVNEQGLAGEDLAPGDRISREEYDMILAEREKALRPVDVPLVDAPTE